MKYTIGFRSGKTLELEVVDGRKFVDDIVKGVKKNSLAHCQWWCEAGYLLAIHEVEFIVPSPTEDKKEKG